MNGWELVVLTAALSILASLVTAKVTSLATHKNEIRKWQLEKRTEFYIDFYTHIELVLSDRTKIFEAEYFQSIIEEKPKIKLLASPETYEAVRSYFDYVQGYVHAYKSFCDEKNPYHDISRLEVFYNNEGEEDTAWFITSQEIKDFEEEKETYKRDHRPSFEEINAHINPIYKSMRKDLGSNI